MKKILALIVLGAFSMVTFAATTNSDDTKNGVLIVFQKGPHTVPIPDPPPYD